MHLRDPFAQVLRYESVSSGNEETKGVEKGIATRSAQTRAVERRRHAIEYNSAPLTRYATRLRMFMSSLTTGLQWLYTTLRLRQALPVVVLISYSLIGAGIFYATEHQAEIQEIQQRIDQANDSNNRVLRELRRWRREFVERLWEIQSEGHPKLRSLHKTEAAISWYEAKIRAGCLNSLQLDEALQIQPIWDFWGALFYAGTIATTIGYGNIVPVTQRGRYLTIGYSVIGIPMLVVFLHKLGRIFCKLIQKFWNFLLNLTEAWRGKQRRNRIRRQSAADPEGKRSSELKGTEDLLSSSLRSIQLYDVPISLALTITLAWMVTCSGIFMLWEDWDYSTSFYFFFISLTTIGLGDVVPDKLQYMLMNFGLVIIGLSLVSMCINIVQVKAEHFFEEMILMIQKRYQDVQIEGEEGDMGEDNLRARLGLGATWKKIPNSKWLLKLIGEKQKETLLQEWKQKAKMKVKGTQTDRFTITRATQTNTLEDTKVPTRSSGTKSPSKSVGSRLLRTNPSPLRKVSDTYRSESSSPVQKFDATPILPAQFVAVTAELNDLDSLQLVAPPEFHFPPVTVGQVEPFLSGTVTSSTSMELDESVPVRGSFDVGNYPFVDEVTTTDSSPELGTTVYRPHFVPFVFTTNRLVQTSANNNVNIATNTTTTPRTFPSIAAGLRSVLPIKPPDSVVVRPSHSHSHPIKLDPSLPVRYSQFSAGRHPHHHHHRPTARLFQSSKQPGQVETDDFKALLGSIGGILNECRSLVNQRPSVNGLQLQQMVYLDNNGSIHTDLCDSDDPSLHSA